MLFKNFLLNFNTNYKISVLRDLKRPPFGGGNQFILALINQLKKNDKISIYHNAFNKKIDAYLIDYIWLNKKYADFLIKNKPKNLIHRLDGLLHFYRDNKEDKYLDDYAFKLNNELATKSIVQSNYSFELYKKFNYKPTNPFIIHNAVNDKIFFKNKNKKFNKNKIKIVSTSWSDNKNKGIEIYKWLDNNLDFNKIEYNFIGRINCNFKNIKKIKPVNSIILSQILRDQDIYITASKEDACSNSLLEALNCGLPSICLNSGGHPELIKGGGFIFNNKEEVPNIINLLSEDYFFYRNQINVESIQSVAKKYFNVILGRDF